VKPRRIGVEWADGYVHRGVKPNLAAAELEGLKRKLKRLPNAADVVRAAARATSPLHKLFTWDTGKAARLYREAEARDALRHLVVIYEDKAGAHTRMRLFTAVTFKEDQAAPSPNGHSRHLRVYETTAHVLKDPVAASEMLTRGWRELMGWVERYGQFAEFSGIAKFIEKADRLKARAA
jgi:hypothetical protein